MALAVMVIVALLWCAWLAWDGVQECRRIDRSRTSRLADCVEARQ